MDQSTLWILINIRGMSMTTHYQAWLPKTFFDNQYDQSNVF